MILEKIHKTVIESIGDEVNIDNNIILIIGQWYYDFLQSEEEQMKISIPLYNKELAASVYLYLRYFSLTYHLLTQPELKNFVGTCLFDLFNQKLNRSSFNVQDYILSYSGEKGGIIKWGNSTITNTRRFLPVFKQDQIENIKCLKLINYSFKIFQSISKNNLINFPILIDLEDNILTLKNSDSDDFNRNKLLKIYDEYHNSFDSNDKISNKANLLEDLHIKFEIIIKVPYHRDIHQFLILKDVKKIEINFNTRFLYDKKKLLPTDVILLPKELIPVQTDIVINPKDYYLIYNTNHDEILYDLFHELKSDWDNYSFNKYTTPFPKYWLMFINPIISEDNWISLFERCYPLVSQKPIMNTIKKIIQQLYKLNWIKGFIETSKTNYCFIFPEIKGYNSKKLKVAYSYFESYVCSLNPLVSFDSDIKLSNSNNLILNGFDLIDSVNKIQINTSISFLIPDFVYYLYYPWIKYNIYDYQAQVLLNHMRREFDRFYCVNKEKFDLISSKLLQEIRNDLINYKLKYFKQVEPEVELILPNDDYILNGDEENDSYILSTECKTCYSFIIETEDNSSITVQSTDRIFVYRHSLINIDADQIIKGDLFFTCKDLYSLKGQNSFLDKLSDIPESVKDFQNKLLNRKNVYDELVSLGLKYESGAVYFNSKYCLNVHDDKNPLFLLPRKRKNWTIICNVLNIEPNDMSIAFISYYGRTRKNQIKNLYKSVLDYIIANNALSKVEDSETFRGISKIVESHNEIFKQIEDFDLDEITRSILDNIENELLSIIKEAKTIIK